MATTQSGYPVLSGYHDPDLLSNPEVPGAKGVKLYGGVRRGDVATVLLYIAARWHAEVEGLQQVLGVWGAAFRKIAGSNTWSNHAGAVAIDLNSARHPQGKKGTFTASQVAAIRRIMADAGVIGWGGEWTGASVDEMHSELARLIANTGRVEKVAAQIRAGKLPNTPAELLDGKTPADNPVSKPAPVGKPAPAAGTRYTVKAGDTLTSIAKNQLGDGSKWRQLADLNKLANPDKIYVGQVLLIAGTPDAIKPPKFPLPTGYYYGPLEGPARSISGSWRTDTQKMRDGLATWQRRMKDRGWNITVDGYYGPQTGNAARQFQREAGLHVDGLIGKDTWAAAWTAPIK